MELSDKTTNAEKLRQEALALPTFGAMVNYYHGKGVELIEIYSAQHEFGRDHLQNNHGHITTEILRSRFYERFKTIIEKG